MQSHKIDLKMCGEWEVILSDGTIINEKDIERKEKAPWLILRDRLAENSLSIKTMKVKIGKLTSESPIKGATKYFFGRKAFGIVRGPSGLMIGHGFLDDRNIVVITWCSADGRSFREKRSREACEKWLI